MMKTLQGPANPAKPVRVWSQNITGTSETSELIVFMTFT